MKTLAPRPDWLAPEGKDQDYGPALKPDSFTARVSDDVAALALQILKLQMQADEEKRRGNWEERERLKLEIKDATFNLWHSLHVRNLISIRNRDTQFLTLASGRTLLFKINSGSVTLTVE